MYEIQQGNEEINSNGGISLIGALLSNVNSFMKFDKITFGKVKKGVNSHSGILRSIIGLLSLGHTDFADIKLFREDKLFRDCLKLAIVSSKEAEDAGTVLNAAFMTYVAAAVSTILALFYYLWRSGFLGGSRNN